MAFAKKNKLISLQKKIVFLYLALFPLGQLLRFETNLFGKQFAFHPIDIVAGFSIPFFVFGFLKIHAVYKKIWAFLFVAVFSLFLSLGFTDITNVLLGSFYLIRFFAYTTFFLLTLNLILSDVSFKKTLFNALILITIFVGLFGWLQYIFAADLTALKILGWDNHMYRLAGTFLDPGFTSIILVLGFLALLAKFLDEALPTRVGSIFSLTKDSCFISKLKFGDFAEKCNKKQKRFLPILVFLLVSIAFTYARASYLALFVGVFINSILQKRKAVVLLMAVFFLCLIPFLPRPYGEGVKLERTHSIYAKYDNYIETFEIIKKQPLFGVGFNNMCFARVKYLRNVDDTSHACSGSDSSLLFVLATTGIVGLIVFANMFLKILKSIGTNIYGKAFLSCSTALLAHSLFVHSLFYPWVMGWMGILFALSIKNEFKAKN